jgi:ubiquinone/menaquinone biosynthesis C-methylase UbiE
LKEFEKAAERFDDNHPSVYNMCRKDYPDILEEVRKEHFSTLLDAGCGTGAMLQLFKKDLPDKKYTGLDLSGKMIEVAKKKQMNGVELIVGDCEALPFENNSFDVVTCTMSFHHYPNPDKFFLNLHRVLKTNGRFILRDMASRKRFMMWFFNHIEIPLMNKIARKGDVHVYTEEELQRLCDDSGLTLESYEVRKDFRLHCVVRKNA